MRKQPFLTVLVLSLLSSRGLGVELYRNDFNGPLGSIYPEWTGSQTEFASAADPPGKGTRPPQRVTNCDSANHKRRFLGEFGGERIGTVADPGYNRTRVDQTIRLALDDLPPHEAIELSVDLYVLKSWDGNSPQYGPDRWKLAVDGGPALLDTTFSNNPKVERQGSYQDYPRPQSPPRAAAAASNTLGYEFFGDATYPLRFAFPHSSPQLTIEFTSSLYEGKGLADESWGLDNVTVQTVSLSEVNVAAPPSSPPSTAQ